VARCAGSEGSCGRADRIGRYRLCVGFNPYRPSAKRRSDIVLVLAAFMVVIALVAWAAFGR
jgi:hypothetical protein